MKRITVLLVFGMLPWSGVYAADTGQTAQTTFRVSATVNAVCEVTATDLSFGAYTSNTAGPLLGTTVLKATCSPGTTYNVGLNEGTSPGATVNQRKMVAGTNNLNYQLYSDASRTTIWGNTPGTDTVTGSGTGVAVDHTVYGTVPPKQIIPAGAYQDTITVRVFY